MSAWSSSTECRCNGKVARALRLNLSLLSPVVGDLQGDVPMDFIAQTQFELALRLLIDTSLRMQEEMVRFRARSDRAFLNDFCTVRLTCSRRSGHTTAMLKVAKDFFENPAFLLGNDAQRAHARDFSRSEFNAYSDRQFFSDPCLMRGSNFDAIFVDCGGARYDAQREEDVYSCAHGLLLGRPRFCLVFLQQGLAKPR